MSSQAGRKLPQTKSDYAVDAIREMLRDGTLAPGARVNVDAMAASLGVSPTPVREAIRALQAEGYLTHAPHRSVQVANVSQKDVVEIYRIRAVLEGLSTELAVPQLSDADLRRLGALHETMERQITAGHRRRLRALNDEFHFTIHRAARAPRLLNLINTVWRASPFDTFVKIPERASRTIVEHRAIIDALRDGSAQDARDCMSAHVHASLDLLLFHLDQPASDGKQAAE